MDADLTVMILVLFIVAVNRHSLIFLCAFALSEIPHLLDTNPVYDNIIVACSFAITAFLCSKIKYELQMSLICYSVLFWFSAFDYFLFPHKTYFYVIFPYVIKLIDIYVIYHLINNKEKAYNGISSSHWRPFY